MKMRIGFDAKRAFHNTRGLGNYGRNLIQGLNFYHPNHEYFLYTPEPENKDIHWSRKYPDMHIRYPKSIFFKTFHPLWRSFYLSREIKEDTLDIFHGLSHELPFGIDKLDIKTIVTVHDIIFMKYPHSFSSLDRMIYRQKYCYSTRIADRVVAICEHTKKDLIRYLNVPEHKIDVIHQGCHERYYTLLPKGKVDEVKHKYHLPSKYILYVGAIEENKNIFSLIRAFSGMRDNDYSLVLVGRGKSYKEVIIGETARTGIEKRVRFLDDVPDTDLPAIYQGAQFFVYPSFYEGFGIPIVEALFSGLPVITSPTSGMPEAAGPGALYADPNSVRELKEAMDQLSVDEAMGNMLAQKGRHYVEKFHRQKTIKDMMGLYNGLTAYPCDS